MNTETNNTNQSKFEMKNPSFKISSTSVLIVLIGILLVSTIYFYQKAKSTQHRTNVENSSASNSVINKVGKLMILPTDETPTIAIIEDHEKLKDQPFFKNARNGDTLLVYTKAQQAILFREKANLIINVGPVALNDMQSVTSKDK